MMYQTDIANMALGRLGVSSTINDLANDDSVEAQIIRRHFKFSLDYLLEQHQWNFARGVAQLILQFDNPEPAWEYSYHMPADCLVIRQLGQDGRFLENTEEYLDQKVPFTEVTIGTTRLLYTNLDKSWALYTRSIAEADLFPNHFGRALAALLSKDIAPSLITNNYPKVKAALNDEADNDIAHGIADDLARQPQFINAESSFVRTRY